MDIIKIRLANQRLAGAKFETPAQVVAHMGAMQAQDFGMACWGVGVRMDGATLSTVLEAFDKGEILRTHVLRPTWHLVAAQDLRRILTLTGPKVKSSTRSRDRDLGLDEALFGRCNDLIVAALEGGRQLTREELARALEAGGVAIKTGDALMDTGRINHIVMRAELDALICSGAMSGKKHTYALFDERVPNREVYDRDDALERLARSYFTSHAPATLQDFAWWSGLSLTDVRRAVEIIGKDFQSIETPEGSYIVGRKLLDCLPQDNEAHLLPAFDEFVVSYKERGHIISAAHYAKAITKNGIFRPTVTVGGRAVGLWSKTTKGKKATIETDYFTPQSAAVRKQVEQASEQACRFYNNGV